jgi:hypothetical protein
LVTAKYRNGWGQRQKNCQILKTEQSNKKFFWQKREGLHCAAEADDNFKQKTRTDGSMGSGWPLGEGIYILI